MKYIYNTFCTAKTRMYVDKSTIYFNNAKNNLGQKSPFSVIQEPG